MPSLMFICPTNSQSRLFMGAHSLATVNIVIIVEGDEIVECV